MTQNTSHAVMAQRAEPHDSLDFFPTPPWATRALSRWLLADRALAESTVWEPACGQGHMARTLAESFGHVWSSDCFDYGHGEVHDFLMPGPALHEADWIVTNPPYKAGAQFILRALEIATTGVAMLVRTQFIEGVERHKTLFKPHRPAVVAPFVERVPMVKGRYDPKASTATSYCWIVWTSSSAPYTEMVWIPPCRKELERQEDFA